MIVRAMTKNQELSREAQTELSRSKKKVKEGHHTEFNDGLSESGHSLEGEILRACAKAFDFSDLMDTEADSDEEVEELRFNFLQSKLNLLWKLSGTLDCVDFGKEFYSVRFSLKEDMDVVHKNGPWFIGGHFLSIRPWEPFFKLACASVSSIVVWVRLHELPMELYETEVLKQIGESIWRVLWINSHTTMEARGRYVRLYIQLDITKPLINTVLIGRFEWSVVYKGLHKLCFSCRRIGHRKETCPFTIKRPKTLVEGGPMRSGVDNSTYQGAYQCELHDSSYTVTGSGTTKDRSVGTKDDKYGP
nr:uncharacterized protein CFP56_06763 [Quercus suber]